MWGGTLSRLCISLRVGLRLLGLLLALERGHVVVRILLLLIVTGNAGAGAELREVDAAKVAATCVDMSVNETITV